MKKPVGDPVHVAAQQNAAARRWHRRVAHALWARSYRKQKRIRSDLGLPAPRLGPGARAVHAHRGYKRLVAPKHFSIVDNPDESLRYIARIGRFLSDETRCFIDVDAAEIISPDAALVLRATLARGRRDLVRGNMPSSPHAALMLQNTGFPETVTFDTPVRAVGTGRMCSSREVVAPDIADDYAKLAAEAASGPGCPYYASYEIAIECMANTRNHAGKKKTRTELWWFGVSHDLVTGVASLAFVDTGVGILNSAKLRGWRRGLQRAGLYDPAGALRSLLAGHATSETNLANRGEGLKMIGQARVDAEIQRLVVVANGALVEYADAGGRTFNLSSPFSGSLFYWELHPSTGASAPADEAVSDERI